MCHLQRIIKKCCHLLIKLIKVCFSRNYTKNCLLARTRLKLCCIEVFFLQSHQTISLTTICQIISPQAFSSDQLRKRRFFLIGNLIHQNNGKIVSSKPDERVGQWKFKMVNVVRWFRFSCRPTQRQKACAWSLSLHNQEVALSKKFFLRKFPFLDQFKSVYLHRSSGELPASSDFYKRYAHYHYYIFLIF